MPFALAPAVPIAPAPQPIFIPGFGIEDKPPLAFVEFIGASGAGASPQGSFGLDQASNVRVYDVAWEHLQGAVVYFLGSQSVKDAAGVRWISRDVPHHDRDWGVYVPAGAQDMARKDQPYLYGSGLDYQGWAVNEFNPPGAGRMQTPQGTARYRIARLRVRYETRTYEILSDKQMIDGGFVLGGVPDEATLKRYITILPRPKGTYIQVPAGPPPNDGMKFVPGGQPVGPPGPGKIQCTADLQIIHHLLPEHAVPSILVNPALLASGNLGAIDKAIGKVNSAPLLGNEPGTLLYLPPEFVPRRGPRGERLWDVHHMIERARFTPAVAPRLYAGHNFVLRRQDDGTLRYQEVSANGATLADTSTTEGLHIYDAVDLLPCFRPPPP